MRISLVHSLPVALVALTLAAPVCAATAPAPAVESVAPPVAPPVSPSVSPDARRQRLHHAWREQLTPEQRAVADAIIDEARPRLRALRQQVHDKVRELKGFAYAEQTDPEVLPRLGRELQGLRDELHREIMAVRQRISEATGVSLGDHPGRGCSNLSNRGY